MLDSTSQATYTTTWYDPVGLEVNHVADTVNWNWNGYTTYFNWGGDSREWLWVTGWFEASHAINYYSGSTQVGVWTDDHMQNNRFCAGQTTNVWYQRNGVYGYANGAKGGSVGSSANGGCASWLHWQATLS